MQILDERPIDRSEQFLQSARPCLTGEPLQNSP